MSFTPSRSWTPDPGAWSLRRPLVGAGVLALLLVPAPLRAGCLSPSDTAIDVGVGTGPLWGNDAGDLLYVRQGTAGHSTLMLRTSAGAEQVAVEGDSNGFSVGGKDESWGEFHGGTINVDDDVAVVASTKLPDDPSTPGINEAVSRRGVYVRRGNTFHELSRVGNASPVRDAFNVPVPWGSVFDAVAADRDAQSVLTVVFSGQLAGTIDHRTGLFRWSELTSNTVRPALLEGAPSPAGGTFVSFGRLRGNGPGDAAFFGVTKLTDSSPQVPGLFLLKPDDTSARVVKFGDTGDSAPGGGTFARAGDFDLDDAGVLTFAAILDSAPHKTGLFRAKPPFYVPEAILFQGDATPHGGTYESFQTASLRASAAGEVVFGVTLSDDVGADGVFTIPPDGATAEPLVTNEKVLAVAALGAGRGAYMTSTQIRVAVPSDGSLQGPTDYRIFNLDLRNSVPLRTDTLKFEGRFQLGPWDAVPPATFRSDATRLTPTQTLTGAALTKIAEVKLSVSAGPGNNFAVGLSGPDAAPTGTFRFNGQPQTLKKLAVSTDGSTATWTIDGGAGPGTISVDLLRGTFKLSVARATVQPSYDPSNFRVAFLLRSEADVAQARTDAQSFFVRDLRISAQQPKFGSGRRVTSKGEGTPGGTVFLDTLKVVRTPASGTKPKSDSLQLAGTLRICPGTSAPATPKLKATLHLGDLHLDAVEMTRLGKKGASYRYTAAGVDFRVDLVKATFSVRATSTLLNDLVDPVAGSPTNGPEKLVGGMQLAFSMSIPRVYDVAFTEPVVRQPGGKVFTR